MKELEVKDIYSLIKENEREKKELDAIKKHIENQPPTLLTQRNEMYREFLFNDMHKDGYVMEYPHGTVVRQSDRKWHYRGENSCYPTSQPTFIRKLKNKSKEEREIAEFVANLKLIHFFDILNKLDHYHSFRNMHFTHSTNGTKVYLDVLHYNIAQHYGFDTNCLDITSDFEVALFFACCKYSDNKWAPLNQDDFEKNEESRYGRIFRRELNNYRNMMFPDEKYVVFPVGFQPFMRCHMQYSYAIFMEEDMDLNSSESGFECLKFKHSEELCNYIYSKMNNGVFIYPQEGLSVLSDELDAIQNSTCFSLESFRTIYNNLNFGYSESELIELLKKAGIEIGRNITPITDSKIAIVNKHYEDFDVETLYDIKLRMRWIFTP
ncbi:FRG domain-containing protein [Bacteroidales bacterium OttesenSCG-928-C19]|nr:FRG domain-containing protein [Bacteroidales bacterium OttesenSCG-928-C19]